MLDFDSGDDGSNPSGTIRQLRQLWLEQFVENRAGGGMTTLVRGER